MATKPTRKIKSNPENFLELYATLDGWTESEAVLLSLSIDPREPFTGLDHRKIRTLNDIPGYASRIFMLARAVVAFGWHGFILPSDFVKWANSKHLSIPSKLISAVQKTKPITGFTIREQNPNAIVFKEKTEAEKWLHESNMSELNALRFRYQEDRVKIRKKRAEENINPKSRTSLLKIVIGVAVDKYRYDSKANVTYTASQIQSSVERAGLTIDDDTVRRWLREAAELLKDPK